jgi:hypothetical protein
VQQHDHADDVAPDRRDHLSHTYGALSGCH